MICNAFRGLSFLFFYSSPFDRISFLKVILTVRPSRDFLQELLWHGRNLIVLKPESLRQEMIGILKDMTKSYETGECLNGEE